MRTHGQDYVKDLRRLGRCLSRTVLVDNDPFSGLLQPCNVVPASPFYGDPSDRCSPSLVPHQKGIQSLISRAIANYIQQENANAAADQIIHLSQLLE